MTRYDPLLNAIKLAMHKLRKYRASGPEFAIVRRFHQPDMPFCSPGEETVDVRLSSHHEHPSVPFSTIQRFIFDYMSRHRCAQNAESISLGMQADPFIQKQGDFSGARPGFKRIITGPAVKMNMRRMRDCLDDLFEQFRCPFQAERVLVSEPTEGKEVRYKLRAIVRVVHV